ncbi:MAG: xylanase [Clostridia bacterium]|nr:xylanase [Clostridia bacterium]
MRTDMNAFSHLGIDMQDVRARAEACLDTLFFDPQEKIYLDVDADSGCMVDTGNMDARTEGMSYGMMMAVQMDRKDLFDKLWTFSMRYMYQKSGIYQGYFAWSVDLKGHHNAEGPAPDGEEYFAMALFMASARWGDGEGIFEYSSQAREILRHCLHQDEMVQGGRAMWDRENKLIRFVPEANFSDPSYHLMHFYELFAQRADEADRPFWKKAAEASRHYIHMSAHPVTGMCAEYAEYDGSARLMFRKPYAFYSDAYRVAMNIALDTLWFGPHKALCDIATHLQDFYHGIQTEDYMACQLDGTMTDEHVMHPTGLLATLAAASIASSSAYRDEYLKRFWEMPLRKGTRRYYDNCLYFFSLLMLGGLYRIW